MVKFRSVDITKNVTLRLTHVKICINGEYFEVDFHVILDALLNDEMIIGAK